MSADFSANGGAFRKHSYSPYRGQDQGPRDQAPGSMVQTGMQSTSPSGVLAYGLPIPAAEMATNAWQTQDSSPALAQAGQYATVEKPPHLRAQASGQIAQKPVSHSRSSNFDTLSHQNVRLQNELEELRLSRDETQEACDNMLTELITTQEALAERDAEVLSLREQLSHRAAEGQGSLSRNDERELRDLRLRCNRLQGELRQRDEQVHQAQTQTRTQADMQHAMHSKINMQDNRELLDSRQRYMDAEDRASRAEHMRQQAQQQADLYEQQLREWSVAYEGLKVSYDDLQRTHSESMHTTRSQADEEAVRQQLTASKAAVEDVKKMRDFYKNNSENVARKNIEVTDLLRKLQDELQAKTREFELQRSMLQQLQVQVR